jgi:MFS family permease
MFAQGYAHLLIARAFVGLGEAGYGSVGAAMVATHFPLRMRSRIMGGFFASASVGSVLGIVLGGVIASRFGWQAGFGVVGIPGLIVALLYFFVRDYKTVEAANNASPSPARAAATTSRTEMIQSIFGSWTVRWVCIGACVTNAPSEYDGAELYKEMKEGPSRPTVRCRSQATASCCRQERWW